jgi:hypothetical protein
MDMVNYDNIHDNNSLNKGRTSMMDNNGSQYMKKWVVKGLSIDKVL